ncbi:MAG: hypothetical protein KatS3mg060_1163 [Dehalococcoidia bacterium]|nr:MAG: hypothetical protein KatS3mg060_1163 [Dehalococcoidia bacterium]
MPRLHDVLRGTIALEVETMGVTVSLRVRAFLDPAVEQTLADRGAALASASEEEARAYLYDALAAYVAWWDITEEDGSMLALTPETLARVPVRLLTAILQAIGQAVRPDPQTGITFDAGSGRTATTVRLRTGTS